DPSHSRICDASHGRNLERRSRKEDLAGRRAVEIVLCKGLTAFRGCLDWFHPLQPLRSCHGNTVRAKSFDIAHGRLAEEAAVLSVELADTLVADFVSCTRCVHSIHKHPLSCPLQPQLLLVLKRAHRGQCAELMMKCRNSHPRDAC